MEKKGIRVLLVDDNRDFLESARRSISSMTDIEVVGHALTGLDAIDKVERLKPDVVLMDISMPEMTGLEATKRIKRRQPSQRIIILTLNDLPEYRDAAVSVGADGYLSKSDFTSKVHPLVLSLFSASS